MTKRLIPYSIPDDFSPDRHIALGPWCFYGREALFPDWENLAFIDPFDEPDVKAQAANQAIQTANALLDELWPTLNERFGTTHSRAFWHTILMNWLLHLVMLSSRLWAHVALFVEQHKDEPLEVTLDDRAGPFRFAGTFQFVMACFGPSPFRRWLVSEILRRQLPPGWIGRDGQIEEPPQLEEAEFKASRWNSIGSINGMSRFWLMFFKIYLRIIPKKQISPQERTTSDGFPQDIPSQLLDLLRQLVSETIPTCVFEKQPAWQKSLLALPFRKGRLHVTIPFYHNDQGNLENALAVEAGERLAMLQHGGTYGWAKTVSVIGELEFCHEIFLSWGWKTYDDYRGNFIPMPPPLIGSVTGRHRPQDDRMILVGAAMYSLNPRIDNYPEPVAYRKRKRLFIEALSEELRDKLGYRPYRDPLCFTDADYLQRFFPALKIVEGDLMQAMLRAKLVVQDHHSTTLSITLGANIPTIGLWDDRAWALGDDAKPYFERLRKVGILFDDPAEAARHIDRIWPDVDGWWKSREVQDARKAWAARFGWGTRWWWLHWILRLPRL